MDIIKYFHLAAKRKASDLHLIAGNEPALRINGELMKLNDSIIKDEELREALKEIADERTLKIFELKKEHDFAFTTDGLRFRVNLHYQEGMAALAARLIPDRIPAPEEIGFNETIYQLTHLRDGLIIVTGPTGSGKSTTLAGMINLINRERQAHIITIEDPIEFLFEEQRSIIEQRELGIDTYDFATALKHALRQDPNVIMVGEMRDLETISSALTAAETGHLVISTLHTSSAPETISRIIDAFPAQHHQQILNQLSMSLRAVIAQQLIPSTSGALVAAREILVNTRAAANLIRSNQIEQLYSIMQTGLKEGMITMNRSIDLLMKKGLITTDTARNRIRDPETLQAYY
jgi:twitching motility protein PilT